MGGAEPDRLAAGLIVARLHEIHLAMFPGQNDDDVAHLVGYRSMESPEISEQYFMMSKTNHLHRESMPLFEAGYRMSMFRMLLCPARFLCVMPRVRC
jgi:hypothetical protein